MKTFKEAPGLRRWRGLLALPVLLVLVYGCGPGFPIITEEQQDLIDKVDKSAKDTTVLQKRIATLESRGADKEGVEALKLRLAETTKAVEDLGREFSFARGSMEEAGNTQAQASSEIAAIEETMRGLTERIRSLEAAKAATLADVSKLKKALETATKKMTALEGEYAKLRHAFESQAFTSLDDTPPPVATVTKLSDKAGKPVTKAGRKEKAASKKDDPEALYFKGFKLTKDREYEKARAVFKRYLRLYPRSKLADHARYWLGEIYYTNGNWERAILEFDRVIKEYPGGDKVPAAILKEGFSFEKLGSKKEARLLLERLVKKYPESPEAKIAKERLRKLKK